MELAALANHLMEPAALLTDIMDRVGRWIYVALFAIVFAETGLVFAPFLPGDSLLFAVGTFAGAGFLSPWLGSLAVFVASVLGDSVNYAIGRCFGTRLAARYPRLIPAHHLKNSRAYLERYGGRTIFLARFVPVVRSFAPLAAGVSRMPLVRFWAFNIAGALAWVVVFLGAGYFFGRIPWVEENLLWSVLLIVFVSVIPVIVKAVRGLRRQRRGRAGQKREDEEDLTA